MLIPGGVVMRFASPLIVKQSKEGDNKFKL